MPNNDGISGPHLAAAFLCEKVLQERDGVPSYIRAVDRFTVLKLPTGAQLPPGMALPTIQAHLVIALKAGDLAAAKYKINVTLVKPDGSEVSSQEIEVFFSGSDDNGVAVTSPMAIPNPDEGLHWFDVYFEGQRLTRVPMRVLFQKIQLAQFPTIG
jgi:hypothetical protein